jgi:hypothetical protein
LAGCVLEALDDVDVLIETLHVRLHLPERALVGDARPRVDPIPIEPGVGGGLAERAVRQDAERLSRVALCHR